MDSESVAWPSAEPSYRFRPPAAEEAATLDVLAAVLDAAARSPERISLRVGIGRRTDLVGPRRVALETLSGHADVTVAADHTIGTVPLTGGTFDALVDLQEDIERAIIWDPEGVAIADLRDGRLRFALPADAIKSVREEIEGAADRIEQAD